MPEEAKKDDVVADDATPEQIVDELFALPEKMRDRILELIAEKLGTAEEPKGEDKEPKGEDRQAFMEGVLA
jgi:hypothetical protein